MKIIKKTLLSIFFILLISCQVFGAQQTPIPGQTFGEHATAWNSNDTELYATRQKSIGEYSNNIETAIAAIGSTPTTLIIDRPLDDLTANATIPATLSLIWMQGCPLGGAFTFNIKGSLRAGNYKLFESSLTAIIDNNGIAEADWWELVHNSSGSASANATALQAAFDATRAKGVELHISSGLFYYDTTLLVKGNTLTVKGSGNINNATITGLLYTGTGDGIKSNTPGTRIWDLNLTGLAFICNNTANTGHGLNLTSLNRFKINDIFIQGFGGYAVYVYSDNDNGLASCSLENIYGYENSNGLYVGGITTTVSDSFFKNITMRSLLNPNGTGSTGYSHVIASGSVRNNFYTLMYKQDASDTLAGAIILKSGASGNNLYGCGGEVNQSVDELEVESGAESNKITGFSFQDRSRITISDTSTMLSSSQRATISGDYPITYASVDFMIENPANAVDYDADFLPRMADTDIVDFVAPMDGSVIAISAKRYTGAQTTGGSITFYPAKNSARMVDDGSNVSDITCALTDTVDEATHDQSNLQDAMGEARFSKGDNINISYKTAGWDGTGKYVVTIILAFIAD